MHGFLLFPLCIIFVYFLLSFDVSFDILFISDHSNVYCFFIFNDVYMEIWWILHTSFFLVTMNIKLTHIN